MSVKPISGRSAFLMHESKDVSYEAWRENQEKEARGLAPRGTPIVCEDAKNYYQNLGYLLASEVPIFISYRNKDTGVESVGGDGFAGALVDSLCDPGSYYSGGVTLYESTWPSIQ